MAPGKGVCRDFANTGSCRFGAKCKFDHVAGESGSRASEAGTSSRRGGRGGGRGGGKGPSTKGNLPSNLQQWGRDIRNIHDDSELHPVFISAFLHQAQVLLKTSTPDIQHKIFETLATEGGGLSLIRQATGSSVEGLAKVALPLLEVITHDEAVSSLVLEEHVNSIYGTLYGDDGSNGVRFFHNLTQFVVTIHDEPDKTDSLGYALALGLETCERMLALNQSAAMNEDMKKVIQELSEAGKAVLDNPTAQGFFALAAKDSWKEIQSKIELGQQPTEANSDVASLTDALSQVQILPNHPGHLCENGPRHDNDHADIKDIKILPTADEILSEVSDYLPLMDTSTHHLRGVEGLLDRQFRLLREDSVGQLRDAVRHLIKKRTGAQRGSQQIRTNVFNHAVITESFFDKLQGLLHVVEFDQPANMRSPSPNARQQAWATTSNLSVDAIVCVIGHDNNAAFYTIVERTPSSADDDRSRREVLDKSVLETPVVSLHGDDKRAAVIVRLVDLSESNVLKILEQPSSQMLYENMGQLVEFPGMLLASFVHTLKALQEMSSSRQVPFSDLLAPDRPEAGATIHSQPPQYAIRGGFKYNLTHIANGVDMEYSPQQEFDMAPFAEASGLDASQSEAFIHALSKRFALIQGPPGTGKSYVGVKIIQTLLDNKSAASLGPILCVCYTNHALDQILEHLIDGGVEGVIRIGGRSKSEKLQEVNLAQLSRTTQRTQGEKSSIWNARNALVETAYASVAAIEKASKAETVASIRAHLEETQSPFFEHFFGSTIDGFKRARHDPEKKFQQWLKGGTKGSDTVREGLAPNDAAKMSHHERQHLYDGWVQAIRQGAMTEVRQHCESFLKEKDIIDMCHNETDLRCLRNASVIGVTTTGLAKNVSLLRRLYAKVLIVEEAGEVLEANMLPAILPSLEHVVAIGDHQQLRPHISNYELSTESAHGIQYSFDVSLFERLIHPEAGIPALPIATLQTQRRMHPLISRLIRNTIYPKLIDSPEVSEYAPVTSMRHRLFWLDHQMPEATDEVSKSNNFEVEMVAAFVTHLVKQGTYSVGQITILTPYLAQFRKLRRRFAGILDIVIGDKDKAVLAAAGMEDEDVSVQKAHLAQQLRISTVDNYQGEESDIIVVSLVRSNATGSVGFLRTPNRINVLLSRARHGMYIVGNRRVAENVQMWKQVTDMLDADGAIGPAIPMFCPQHPQTTFKVTSPDQFSRFSPEGGCSLPCDRPLKCGHACFSKCHAQHLHDSIACQKPCMRPHEECPHECRKICATCDGKCYTKVSDTPLPCGHIVKQLACHESQAVELIKCKVKVKKRCSSCGNDAQIACDDDMTAKWFSCGPECD